jgi:hypothetical protein
MTGPEDRDHCFDPLYATPGHTPHVNDRSREYKVGAAFVAACEAIGVGDSVFGEIFCAQLMAVIRREARIDEAQRVVLDTWKARAG